MRKCWVEIFITFPRLSSLTTWESCFLCFCLLSCFPDFELGAIFAPQKTCSLTEADNLLLTQVQPTYHSDWTVARLKDDDWVK